MYSSIIIGVSTIFTIFGVNGVMGCAANVNATDPLDVSITKIEKRSTNQIEVIISTNQPFNPETVETNMEILKYKIGNYLTSIGKKITLIHTDEGIEFGGRFAIRSLITGAKSCSKVIEFMNELKPNFPDLLAIFVTCQDETVSVI